MGIDRRGKKRSYCMIASCDCEDYDLPMNDGNDCEYCGCKPTKHAVDVMNNDTTVPKQCTVTSTSNPAPDEGLMSPSSGEESSDPDKGE